MLMITIINRPEYNRSHVSSSLFCSESIPTFLFSFFFFNDTATTEIYTLSLHDALPISLVNVCDRHHGLTKVPGLLAHCHHIGEQVREHLLGRKGGGKMRTVYYRASHFR